MNRFTRHLCFLVAAFAVLATGTADAAAGRLKLGAGRPAATTLFFDDFNSLPLKTPATKTEAAYDAAAGSYTPSLFYRTGSQGGPGLGVDYWIDPAYAWPGGYSSTGQFSIFNGKLQITAQTKASSALSGQTLPGYGSPSTATHVSGVLSTRNAGVNVGKWQVPFVIKVSGTEPTAGNAMWWAFWTLTAERSPYDGAGADTLIQWENDFGEGSGTNPTSNINALHSHSANGISNYDQNIQTIASLGSDQTAAAQDYKVGMFTDEVIYCWKTTASSTWVETSRVTFSGTGGTTQNRYVAGSGSSSETQTISTASRNAYLNGYHHLIIDLSVSASGYFGTADGTTPASATLKVDQVHVYRPPTGVTRTCAAI